MFFLQVGLFASVKGGLCKRVVSVKGVLCKSDLCERDDLLRYSPLDTCQMHLTAFIAEEINTQLIKTNSQ